MPDIEPSAEVTPAFSRRRVRIGSRWAGAYSGVGESQVWDIVRNVLEGQGVHAKISKELASNPTARLSLTIVDINQADAEKYDFRAFTPIGEQHFVGATEVPADDAQAVPTGEQPTAARQNPEPIDPIVTNLLDVYQSKGEDSALDYIFEKYHDLIISDRDLDRAGRILSQLDVGQFPSSVLVSFLMATYAHKESFRERPAFVSRVKSRLGQLPDGGEITPYLADLE